MENRKFYSIMYDFYDFHIIFYDWECLVPVLCVPLHTDKTNRFSNW